MKIHQEIYSLSDFRPGLFSLLPCGSHGSPSVSLF